MAKKQDKPKSAKEVQKDLQDQLFGLKNKKKSKEIKKQLEKIELNKMLERKKLMENKEQHFLKQPKLPPNVDPKTVPCVFYINKLCNKGDSCKYMHEKPAVSKTENSQVKSQSKLVCRFLIDAINEGVNLNTWECPNSDCSDVHKLSEMKDVEISLEEFIELSRQSLPDDLVPLNEKSFAEWKQKRDREVVLHKQRVSALKSGVSGAELFKAAPDVFVDDEEAGDVDYNERECLEDEDEILAKFDKLDI